MSIDLALLHRQSQQLSSDRQSVDLRLGTATTTVADRDNLIQAILNRLHTRRGELTSLGHPDYGSRMHELIGNLNNDRIRRLAELYIRECLAQESRIAEIVDIRFAPPSRLLSHRNTLKALIVLRLIAEPEPITLELAVSL